MKIATSNVFVSLIKMLIVPDNYVISWKIVEYSDVKFGVK